MKDNCNKNCSNCNGTELPNISDTKEINIGYSYAYKTDCAGDRYIKAEEVKYLLKCERNKAIDDFVKWFTSEKYHAIDGNNKRPIVARNKKWVDAQEIFIAEQLKAGENQ